MAEQSNTRRVYFVAQKNTLSCTVSDIVGTCHDQGKYSFSVELPSALQNKPVQTSIATNVVFLNDINSLDTTVTISAVDHNTHKALSISNSSSINSSNSEGSLATPYTEPSTKAGM
jgi:uncharacterized membrane protein